MPRISIQHPPKYRKHKATGQAVVTLGGSDHYLGKHGSAASRQEYNRLITLWAQGGGQLPHSAQQEITVTEVMAAYVAFAKGYYRKGGKVTREYGLIVEACRAIKPLYEQELAVKFGPLALKSVRQSLIDAGISRKHINKQVDRIKRMFRWAAAGDDSSQNIPGFKHGGRFAQGRTEANETTPIMPVGDDTVDVTLEHLPAIPADMVRFQRFCGCRPEEVFALRPCDLDRSGDVWTFKPKTHKTEHQGRERMIFIGPKAQEVLLRYLARDAQSHCFRPCDSEAKRLAEQERNRKTPLSCGNIRGSNVKPKPRRKPGTQYTTGSYRRAIHRACDKAGIDRWSPNRLRHSTATEVRKEFGLEGTQIILGHASADVSQVYAERDIAKGLEIARRIG